MTLLNAYAEIDELGGGQFRHTQHIRPIAYLQNGLYRRIVNDFVTGDANWPLVEALEGPEEIEVIMPDGHWMTMEEIREREG